MKNLREKIQQKRLPEAKDRSMELSKQIEYACRA